MANVRKGLLTAPHEWWRHLRWAKRTFGKPNAKRQRVPREKKFDPAKDNPPPFSPASAGERAGVRGIVQPARWRPKTAWCQYISGFSNQHLFREFANRCKLLRSRTSYRVRTDRSSRKPTSLIGGRILISSFLPRPSTFCTERIASRRSKKLFSSG